MKAKTYNSVISKVQGITALFSVIPLLLPHISMAHIYQAPLVAAPTTVVATNLWPEYENIFDASEERYSKRVVVTAYNSEPGQTDDTPFITAWGTRVRDGIIATNDLPRGTRVRFPEAFGHKVFIVEDRMNSRYTGTGRVDIWMVEKSDAINFGAKYLTMEVL